MVLRTIQQKIEKELFKGKVILLFGARRVGKTTLAKTIMKKFNQSEYLNCELLKYKEALEKSDIVTLRSLFGKNRLIVLDEAQNIRDIGKILKLIADEFPKVQIIATGSSAFELQQHTGEPLTGRSRQFILPPLSWQEIASSSNLADAQENLEKILRFGMYPEIYGMEEEDALEELEQIVSNYLYKDILQFENLKKPEVLIDLLRALAFQTGHEVSLNELSRQIKTHVMTVKRYIELLEQCYVIFRLPAFSKNPRNEIGKNQKVFFWDLGIRNTLIRNYNGMKLRADKGQIWENFFICEKKKNNLNHRKFCNTYFWRNYQQQEVDYIEEYDGILHVYECKWSPKKKVQIPTDFKKNYSNIEYKVIDTSNYAVELLKK